MGIRCRRSFALNEAAELELVFSLIASAHRRTDGWEDQVLATVIYDNGLMASHYYDFSRPGFFEKTTIRLIFALVEIELEGWIPLSGQMRCLCTPSSEVVLSRLTGWKEVSKLKAKEIEDVSGPEGWGEVGLRERGSQVVIMDGKHEIEVENMIVGNFAAGGTKADIYMASLRALQSDFLTAIEDPQPYAPGAVRRRSQEPGDCTQGGSMGP